MPTRLSWDGTSILPTSPYASWLLHPPEGLQRRVPPSLVKWQTEWPARQQFIREYTDRTALTKSLRESHQQRHAPEAVLTAIERLHDPNTYLVIAGQQPGLAGGPMYTLYKAIHAIVLARRLTATQPGTYLPAFWNASEDHDLDEVRTIRWLDKDRRVQSFSADLSPEDAPFYSVGMNTANLSVWIDQLGGSTHSSPHRDDVLQLLRDSARHSASIADGFDQLLWAWLGDHGLLIIRPEDEALRSMAAPILRREIEHPDASTRAIETCSEPIRALGQHPQVHKREDRTSFFVIKDNRRLPVFVEKNRFVVGEESHTTDEMLAWLDHKPQAFSPSAVLRPVVQDALLPVAATVLGPGELAYHFLLDEIYAIHSVARPMVVPRIGFTLVESRDERALRATGAAFADLNMDTAALAKRWTRRHSSHPEELQTLIESVQAYYKTISAHAEDIDPTTIPPLQKSSSRVIRELRNAEHLVIRREAARNAQLHQQLTEVKAALFPDNALQERTLSFIHVWMKYGPSIIDDLITEAERALDGEHVFMRLP